MKNISRLRAENIRLKRECEILKKRRRTLRGMCSEVRLDRCTRKDYELDEMCAVLEVSESGYRS